MSRSNTRRRGASAIEFALCLPFVVTLLGGIIDGGVHLATMHSISRAARDGARIGSSTTEPFPANGNTIIANATAAARSSMLGAGFATADFSTTVTWLPDNNRLYWVSVTVTGRKTPFFGNLTPFDDELTQRFVMVTQEQP